MTEMRKTLPAALDAIEPFLMEFRALCRILQKASDRFTAELLLREALTNAVVHGSKSNPEKQVRCAVQLSDRRLRIVVEDDGEGFDWRSARMSLDRNLGSSGRGLELLRLYATQVRFNAKGNAAMVIKRFKETDKHE
jgi:anti-sigma regulatory factor (Ser/Thr protein kinase)